jgi:uncharacterized protein YcbK (DUF882 family)
MKRSTAIALCALVTTAGSTGLARADQAAVTAPVTPVAETSKKDLYLAAKTRADAEPVPGQRARVRARWEAELSRRIGQLPPPQISIYNVWTHETVVVDAQPPTRGAIEIGNKQADQFLRCHFTNQPIEMDGRLVPLLLKAARAFKVRRVEIVSGFRSPKYNLILRKKGHQVARNSQHTLGHAVDIRLPGIPTARLLAWARHQHLGGVGFYPSGFVHMDTGPIRYWSGG